MEQDKKFLPSGFPGSFVRPSWVIAMVCQMLLGTALTTTLVVKFYMLVFTDAVCAPDHGTLSSLIQCTATLEIAANFVLAVAGFRLAALMFLESWRSIPGVMIIASSGILLRFLSGLEAETANWQHAVVTLSLIAVPSVTYLVRHYLVGQTCND